MPKRKRSSQQDAEHALETYQTQLFRALKAAKGFERQRLAKRSREEKLGPEKLERLEREVAVLKSLDLHQTAQAHLCSALLKVKAASESPRLPESVKNGVAKPQVPEEERVALHNVTSALYKRKQVRDVMSKAIPGICQLLGVPAPGSKSKREQEAPPAKKAKKERLNDRLAVEEEADDDDTSSYEEGVRQSLEPEDDGSSTDEMDEEVISRMEAMLGESSSEDEGGPDDFVLKARGARQSFEDDISLPGTDSEPEGDSEIGSEVDLGSDGSEGEAEEEGTDEDHDGDSDAESQPDSPPPEPKKGRPEKKKEKKAKTEAIPPPKNAAFFPSLMTGYISGSESASDIDVAPVIRKNRKGQKARQAIWEKKYGAGAKHVGKNEGKRDAGWDAKKGAVEGAAAGAAGDKPWMRRGMRRNDKASQGWQQQGGGRDIVGDSGMTKAAREKMRDDDGPLHPSWEARKKAKLAQANASFQGKKITFD